MAENLWNDDEAAAFKGDLGLRVYTSRLLGRDPALVLHGGGNTSVKIRETNLLGDEEDILYVKGSGWDLATIEEAGFTPIRMDHLVRLATLPALADLAMVNELKVHQTRASAPTGSVEAIMHACLPFRFVDHTHADALLSVCNTPGGEQRIREIYGDDVVVIPYVMPGFDLARTVNEQWAIQSHGNTLGMVLMNHGLFSFADSARQSYERMIELVNRAEAHLKANNAWHISVTPPTAPTPLDLHRIAGLRKRVSEAAAHAMIMSTDGSDAARSYCARDDLAAISQQGPVTPDHVIRTKRLPMLGNDVDDYVAAYRAYFNEYSPKARGEVTMLDPAPRMVIDQGVFFSVGKTPKDARIVADIAHHTMKAQQRAQALEAWRALPAFDIFEVEYWELEQAKLRLGGAGKVFDGEIALVTGAASGIGKACVESLMARGAAVVGLDIDPAVTRLSDAPGYLGLTCDVTDAEQTDAALRATIERFGGLDMLVMNAGMFPGGKRIAELDDQTWHQVMGVNLDANLRLMRESHPFLTLAPNGGRVVVIGSKNVPAPGPGAGAYSASKAALTQLMRVAALEWGSEGIRINALHPDAVFDTAIWADGVLESRAAHYGMSVEQYKTKNILKTEVGSRDVAELAAEMCGPLFARTTAAQVPVDGGNDRVI